MTDIPLPRLLNASGGTERRIRPISMSVNLSITPLSYASMQLPREESLPARGYVELYTSMGSAGIYRVQSPQDAYGEDITTAELEHAIVEVGDYLVLNEYDEMMAANKAMTTVFSHYRGTKWKLGSVSALGSGQIALQTDHDRVLEAMLAILDQKPDCMMSFDFSTAPWTVNIVSRGKTVAAEGRLSRNVNSAKVIYDDAALCTRVYYEVPTTNSAGEPDTKWTYKDADTISKYGIVEKTLSTGAGYTKEEADWLADEYLKKNKEPRISVEISAEELSSTTGEALDTFTIGKLYRLALPDYGTTVERNVTGLSWSDVYGRPFDIMVRLADEEDTTITFLHDLDAKGGAASSGGGRGRKKQEDVWKEYWTKFEQDDYHFELMAVRVDENDNILQQAGLYIDSDGVLQYARDNENNWMSHLQVQANRINLVVEGSGDNAHIKPAAIVAAINTDGSSIRISADKIDLDGYVTASELKAEIATIDNLLSGKAQIKLLDVAGASIGAIHNANLTVTQKFTYLNHDVSWKSATVVTDASLHLNTSSSTVAKYISSSGEVAYVTLNYVTGGSVSCDTTTINYLGR